MSAAVSWRVGIDLGGTHLRLLGESDNGERTGVACVPTPRGYDDLLSRVASMLASSLNGPVSAIGCGICGTSDDEQAVFVPALPWIEGRPIGKDLSALANAPVLLGMDGHYTLLSEMTEGAAKTCGSAVLVAGGTGIGGAIMLGRKIWRGARGSAGSFGWLCARGGTDDREHGPYEQIASGAALSKVADEYRAGWKGEELVAAARAGDAGAVALTNRFGKEFGRGLAALASVLDPEMIIVGGGLSEAMDVLGAAIEEAMRDCASPNGRQVAIRRAALGSHAGVIGALVATKAGAEVWL